MILKQAVYTRWIGQSISTFNDNGDVNNVGTIYPGFSEAIST